jgi:D-alanine-D-alanine ligase
MTLLKLLPITEIISENDFFDYAAKYEGEAQEITPCCYTRVIGKRQLKIGVKLVYQKLGFERCC